MKSVRKRLTYGNVISSLALFLVLAGGSALAANQLGKNTVGSKQLKKNAVTSAKIKNGSVTGSKLKLSSIGKVPSASNADHATSADSAANATNAANAVNAANAAAVNGQNYVKVYKTLNAGQTVPVASLDGFTITATCNSGNIEGILTSPSGSASVVWAQGSGSGTSPNAGPFFEYESTTAGAPAEIGLLGEFNNYGEATYSGATASGVSVSGVIGLDYDTFDNNPENVCIVAGHMAAG